MVRQEGMGLAPWGALGGGRYKSEEQRQSKEGRQVQASEGDVNISKALESIAKRKNTLITSIALAYVMHKAPYVFPIIGGRKVDHLKGNIEALTLQLSEEDIKEIESAVPFDLGFPHNFLWGSEVPASMNEVKILGMGGTFDYVLDTKVCLARDHLERVSLTDWTSAAHCPLAGWTVGHPPSQSRSALEHEPSFSSILPPHEHWRQWQRGLCVGLQRPLGDVVQNTAILK